MSLTTHVLDTATGQPAVGVPVELFAASDVDPSQVDVWESLGQSATDGDGRARLTPAGTTTPAGLYRLRFRLDARPTGGSPFYPWVDVTVHTPAVPHLHVPLLLSPFGYTTYRGS